MKSARLILLALALTALAACKGSSGAAGLGSQAALAPGGGYVFNTVHNIQADVPPENIIAMWEALQEYGVY